MMIFVHDEPTPKEMGDAITAVLALLESQGATRLSGVRIYCDVWAGDDRLQIKDKRGELSHIEVLPNVDMPGWTAVPRGKFRVRPADQPFNPLAIMANHDD